MSEEKVEEAIAAPEEPIDVPDEPIIEKDDDVEAVEKSEIKEEEEIVKERKAAEIDREAFRPRTETGRRVKAGEIADIDEILDSGSRLLEPEIVDVLLPGCETELLLIGQSKGKFGGGQRRIFRQTQKKTKEGNKPKFATLAVIGNKDGYVGFGYGKAKETVPAREKASRRAKLAVMKIRRGCGSWECGCGTNHSIPFKVTGKCSSVQVTLIPAPKGTGLVVETEIAKILKLAGIRDVWSKTSGHTKTKINLINACIGALRKLSATKIQERHIKALSITEGRTK